jgi:syntaxin 16
MLSLPHFFSPVTTLEKLHAKHVLPGFTDRTAEEREIEAVTTEITKVNWAN